MEKLKQIKEKNTSIHKKGDDRDDTTRLVNTVNNCKLQENKFTESCTLPCLIVRYGG